MDRYETLQKDPKDIMRAAECWEHAHAVAVALGLMSDSVSLTNRPPLLNSLSNKSTGKQGLN
jgi:hypothetical protein